jgi:hypothetical protein
MPHEFQIPAGYVERAISREGRAHSIEELNGPSTALVPVDMQRCFMEHPFAGACRCLPVPAGGAKGQKVQFSKAGGEKTQEDPNVSSLSRFLGSAPL